MTERAGKSMQLPKTQRRSRLRNEVLLESTDDERNRKKPVVQVPDSDPIVPETQPDHDGHFNNDDPGPDNESEFALSPDSLALLQRTAVTKKTEVVGFIPFAFKPLTRDPFPLGDSSASAGSSPSVSPFKVARTASKKLSPEKEATIKESITHNGLTTPVAQEHHAHASHDVSAIAENAYAAPPLQPDDERHDRRSTATPQEMGLFDSPVTEQSHREPGNPLPMQADTTSEVLPSVQLDARPTSGISKVRGAKRSKSGRKRRLSQQLDGVRPPRSRITPRHVHQAGTAGGPASETSSNPRCVSHMDTDGHGVHVSPTPPVQAHASTENLYGHAYAQESQLPNEEHECIAYDKESCNTAPSLVVTTFQDFQDFQDSSAQREFPTSSVRVPSTLPPQRDVTEPEQQPLATVHDQAGSLLPAAQAASSTQASGPCVLPNSLGSVDIPAVLTQSRQPDVHASNHQVESQPRNTEAVMHGIRNPDGLLRMAKSRRELRHGGPILHGLQEQAICLSVEHAMENVRVAILANKYRAQHEITILTQQHKAEIAELRRTIDHQMQSIAEHDKSHQNLREALSRLTDTAKTKQMLVTGLQEDYENLQKSVTNFQKQSEKTLTEKITELENEKRALQQDFGVTNNKLAATQRKMRSTLEDVYVRFVISEFKRKDLAEKLGKQEAVVKEERRKRDEVEKHLLSGVKSIPRQVVDSSDALTKKVELLQTSIDVAIARDSENGPIKECLDALQTLRMTPALTMQDIEKTNSTLRLVHERLNSGLDTLSETVTRKAPPGAELEKFIKEQLQNLQTKMLRYDDVTAENRKTHESNVSLQSQLEAQQQHSKRLEEQIKGYQQAEVTLKAWSDQLERDLKELRDAPSVDTSGLEQEALDLRQQLQKAEEDLRAADIKTEKTEREKEKYKVEDDTAVREKSAKDCESKFAEKERSFKSEIHQLAIERDEKEKTLQELSNRLDAADTQLDELSEKIQTFESESVETTNLQEQLRETTRELYTKDREYEELNRQHQENMEKILELQGLYDKLQARTAQQQMTVQTMRREADSELTKLRQDASHMLQLSSDQASSLQEEKKNLSTRLEQVQRNESKLKHEVTELRATKEADVSRVQIDAGEESRKLAEQHRTEVDDLKRCVGEKDAALKEVEKKLRLAEDQHRTKIVADREAAESNMLKLEQKYRDLLREAREQGNLNQQSGSQAQSAKKTLTEPRETTQAAKPRKKVSRQNHSMLEVPQEHKHRSEKPTSAFHAECSQTQLDDDDLFATQLGEQSEIDDIHHEPGTTTESQDIGNLSMTKDAFNDDLLRVSQRQLKHQVSSSSELSSMSTDELSMMEKTQPVPTGMLRGYDRGACIYDNASYEFSQTLDETRCVPPAMSRSYGSDPFNHDTASTDVGVTSAVDNGSVAGSQSSRSSGRPKSQANTASRMMPPPSNNLGYPRPGIGGHAADFGASTRHTANDMANLKLSSSDPKPPKQSSSNQINSQHDSRHSASNGSEYGSSQDMKQDSTEKRKSSIDQTERDSATKKQRTKSQPRPLNSSPGLSSPSPYGSVSRSKAQKSMPYTQDGAPTSSRSKNPISSSRLRGRISHQAPSSSEAYSPRGQPSLQVAASGPARRSSTRLTRSKNRNGTAFGDGFNERFNEELDQWR